ncbi:hypothetical protein TeGR_g3638 [Tetraparma gracilis]|uniref:Leucine-rich repeat domain-containing protein n=1 Tax=Tetraparma gracilis TaxID=2962635 RepID=A0ABQ6MXA6_9STRA|nr:hypothetical protein TeGR_g3638 [Tetraparma gracilis]
MSKAVVYTGADPTFVEGRWKGEWHGDEDVTDVTVAVAVTGVKNFAFYGCTGLTNLSFLEGSSITTVKADAYRESGITTLQGMEGVRKIGDAAFFGCKDLRTIEGLGCEEMGYSCFASCTLLQSMKGWPASMTVIPAWCFRDCTGMTTVDCDISHVTSIGEGAFYNCTSLLPPSLSAAEADPAAVLAFLKEKSRKERVARRVETLLCLRDRGFPRIWGEGEEAGAMAWRTSAQRQYRTCEDVWSVILKFAF